MTIHFQVINIQQSPGGDPRQPKTYQLRVLPSVATPGVIDGTARLVLSGDAISLTVGEIVSADLTSGVTQ